MRIFVQTFVLLFFVSLLHAQTRDTIYLWPGAVPNETNEKHPAVLSENSGGNVTRINEVTNPAMVVFEPENENSTGVGVIVCPGGGYSILAVDKEGYEIAEWLNTLGYTAFVLQYRVPKNQLGALNDIQRAIRIVRSESEKYHLNPNRIGVIGFSAGGSLCARASTRFSIDSYPGEDAIDQVSARPDFTMLIYPAYLDKGENRSLTPELMMGEDIPPTFLFVAADDGHANSSLVYTQALRDHKIPVELHVMPEGGHGFGMRPGNLAAESWPSMAQAWLDRTIKRTVE